MKFVIKAFAGTRGNPSTTRTADDRRYTALQRANAAAAGLNPNMVNRNVRANAAPASRNRSVGQLRRRGGNL